MAQRYQREIEEILQQVNEKGASSKSPSGLSPAQRRVPRRPGRNSGGLAARLAGFPSPGRFLLAGIALLVAALVLRSTIPGIAGPMTWAGVGLFITAYILFFTRARRPMERRWRGRSMEDASPTRFLERLRTWLGGR